MAKRTRILFGMVALAIVAGALVLRNRNSGEPMYEGRTLSQWLEGHVPTSSANPPYNSPGWHKADQALRRIGSNAVPTLLEMIRAKDPPAILLKLRANAVRFRLVRTQYRYAYQRNEEAEYAFETLGTNAAAAVPELIRIYQDNVSPSSQRCVAQALGHIGRPAVAAVPVLLRDFTHTNGEVRFNAVSAIYGIGGDPDIVVPALRSVLKDPNINVRWNAMVGLSAFEGQARSAVPDLLEALDDPGVIGSSPIKEQVVTALWRIAPEKISKPVIVEAATPMVVNGVTTQSLDVLYNGERNTLIRAGTPVPCVAQFWKSTPRAPLSLYRRGGGTPAIDQFLGRFQVLGVPPPPGEANISVLCVIVDQQVVLCARDNRSDAFLEVRRVE